MDDDQSESRNVNNLLLDDDSKHQRNSRANYNNLHDNEHMRRSTLAYLRESMRES